MTDTLDTTDEVVEPVDTETPAVEPAPDSTETPEEDWKGFLDDEEPAKDPATEPAKDDPLDLNPFDPEQRKAEAERIHNSAAEYASQVAINVAEGTQTLGTLTASYPPQIQQYAAKDFNKLPFQMRNKASAETVAAIAIGKAVMKGHYKPGAAKPPTPPSQRSGEVDQYSEGENTAVFNAQVERKIEASGGKMTRAEAEKIVRSYGGRY
jgi:hypothetical protein